MSDVKEFLRISLKRARLEAAVSLTELNRDRAQELEKLVERLKDAAAAEQALRSKLDDALPIVALSKRLGLSALDERVATLALALELDPLFAITASAVAGEEPRQGLSAKVFSQLLRLGGDEGFLLALGPNHPLVKSAVLESTASGFYPDSLRPWRLSDRARAYLCGSMELDWTVRRLGGVIAIPEDADFQYAARAEEMLDQVLSSGDDVIICIEGAEGAGRRTLAAMVAARHGRSVISVDAGRLSGERAGYAAELRALRLECWLRGGVPLVARVDSLARGDQRRSDVYAEVALALDSEQAVAGPAIVTAQPGAELPEFRRRVVRIRLESPSPAVRTSIWERALASLLPAATDGLKHSFAEVVQRYGLTPGAITRSAANARTFSRGRALAAEDIHAGVAAEIQERFGSLATRMRVGQSWDDLVLPPDTLDDVKAFSARAAHTALVYDQWGFRERLHRGLGQAALFSGPPGTGKTMVAGLIARSLGLELYAVDLSQVVSKWIGETEKQLGRIFDAASMGNVVLLFDEADSLFAKRTEVKSSNDRYANLEVNYLLQRIEDFGGVAILTTNFEGSVDPAFKRRLAAEVRFYAPGLDERERLWRSLLPDKAPREGDLGFRRLAETFKEMSGGHIRNAVLRAAFLAASEGRPISHEFLVRAGQAEYRAMGKVL